MKSTAVNNQRNTTSHSSMKMSVILKIASKNLLARKLRTVLTVMGVIIGVGAVVFLISFGVGLQKLVENQVVGSKSIKTIDVDASESRSLKFDSESISRISGIAGVTKVGKVYTIAGKIISNNSELSSVVYAVNQGYLDLSTFNKVSGKLLEAGDTNTAIVNTSFLKSQGVTDKKGNIDAKKLIGQNITLSFTVPASKDKKEHQAKVDVTVGGVIDSGSGAEVFVPATVVEGQGFVSATELKVLANDRDSVPKIRTDIESRGFSTSSPLDTISEIDKIFQLLQFVLIGFGGVGMVIAVLGMFNTLTITLLERTREIGLIVTLGGQQKDIKRLFITEALMLSITGGALGTVSAFLVGKIADLILNAYARSNGITESLTAFHLSPLLAIGTILAASVIGLVVVFLPARRASRISPLDAMRE